MVKGRNSPSSQFGRQRIRRDCGVLYERKPTGYVVVVVALVVGRWGIAVARLCGDLTPAVVPSILKWPLPGSAG